MEQKGKSNTKIKRQIKKKTNTFLVETINHAREHKGWKNVVDILTGSTRNYSMLNLSEIDKRTKEGDTVIVLGKVLSKGELTKKVRICALSFSEKTLEKLKKTKSEHVSVLQEIKINPKAEGIKILK